MDLTQQIAQNLNIKPGQVAAAVDLLDDGNTVPFIARYRKEATGGLDEDQLRRLSDQLDSLRGLDKRRQTIINTITEQDKMTPELNKKLLSAGSLTALEDLYLPYKPKRTTRASLARKKGLDGLARLILAQETGHQSPAELARPYLGEAVSTVEEALAGARDIVAEMISDSADIRRQTREKGLRWGNVSCRRIGKAEDPREVYKLYYEFDVPVHRLRPHQVLAINRGESEKVIKVKVEIQERDWRGAISLSFRPDRRSPMHDQLALAIDDAAKRLLLPAIERDIRRALTENAEDHAISVFASNIRGLLSQPPMTGYTILAIDPGFRTGCKGAIVDPTGKVLETATIYPHKSKKQWAPALETLSRLVDHYGVDLIAIGNGTASRETEQLIAELIQKRGQSSELHYLIVSEAGASVYSASPLARKELPTLDVTERGAVSIGRRVQDPLAEYVKIEPRSIGVGLYQHDVNQGRLETALSAVVESVVNQVGVDVNTASSALLSYVAGVGPKLAGNIVNYRDEFGSFTSRKTLSKVPGMGPKTFEQSAGFLRIRNGHNPLDASAIHPESYDIASAVLKKVRISAEVPPPEREPALAPFQNEDRLRALANELDAGLPTLADIIEQLIRPGRDPREDLPPPLLRSDVLSMEDLSSGLRLNGTIRNVVDFGVFVDIGVKQDGLLHRSQWPKSPRFEVGQVIEVIVLKVEPERGRISLGWPN